MEQPLQIQVLLFAGLRETFGERQLAIELPAGSTANDLFIALRERKPELDRFRPYTSFAVNQEVTDPTFPLKNGDVVALLQPLSGGCE